ncbi:arginyltransferase [Pseudomaricurvus alcaniphilus]|uniref:arginyltransferase n=1 Tax=Pseudomaricurvus alcaniphilus TaxID=1166482 RepID=UPI00140843A8|nr:arginyltransferase [Pseudomaricurvus alcaniphilus]NHN35830.1 arginyltransferase [Pseudomaricurvus alcaniphilus]
MSNLGNIRLFTTHPHECSYLDDREAVSVFVDPAYPVDSALYSKLSERGFRRSGAHIYRPHCGSCQACIPARIPVADFQMNRNQRRCWQRNQDLLLSCSPSIDTEEHYQLYARYIEARHSDGDMFPPTPDQYRSFLSREWGVTEYLELRQQDGQLLMVAVCDRLDNGYSAVYTFFAPQHDKRSLGSLAILWQIELARNLGLPHVYLGYWIKECAKMSYKTLYRPLELLINGHWLRVR